MVTIYRPIDWTKHPLHAAAASGNRAEVDRLIAAGANVNQVLHLSVRGAGLVGTPLHVTLFDCGDNEYFYRGHHEVVEVLLAAGSDVGLCRMWDGTPLHDAARFGLTRVADMLLSHGADVNSRGDYLHRTPLHLAATYDQPDMIDFLLSRGAELEPVAGDDDRDGARTSPYWRQYDTGSLERRLPRALPLTGTPLQMAARQGHARAARRLIEQGACLELDTSIDLAERARGRCQERFDEVITLLKEKQIGKV
jgi:ankyrin repeat protein